MKLRIAVFLLCISCYSFAAPELDLNYGIDDIQSTYIVGLEVKYLKKGDGEMVLFYHPTVDMRYWQWSIEATSKQFTVIAAPFESAIPSSSPTDPSGLITFLEALGPDPVHLVAHSFGGRQALEMAIARPDLLKSLTVIEPALAPTQEILLELMQKVPQEEFDCPISGLSDSDCATQAQINEPDFFNNAPASLIDIFILSEVSLDIMLAALTPAGEAVSRPVFFATSICEGLEELSMPILFIRGDLTPLPIQGALDAYEECLPPHNSSIITGSSHYPHIYKPEDFNAVLLEFLGKR